MTVQERTEWDMVHSEGEATTFIQNYWARHGKPEQYPSGDWGPASAHEMLARDGRAWRRP